MRSSIVLPLVAVLALGACKQEAVVAKDESVEAVANKVAAAKMTPRPGRWEASMKLGKMDIPGMPAEAKAAMNKQMNVTQSFASCLTPEQAAKPVRYPEDDFVVAVATDAQQQLPEPTQLPVLDLNQPAQVVDWLLEYAHRFEYNWELHGGLLPSA